VVVAGRREFLEWVAGTAASAAVVGVSARAFAHDPADVRRYGAVGDGRSDDTDAIQSAIDRAARRRRPVYFSPGVYRVTRTLRVRSETDLYGSDASFCEIRHDLSGKPDSHRQQNAACILVDNEGPDGARAVRYVSIRRLRLTTTEPRADLGGSEPQTGVLVRHGYWSFRVQEVVVHDFAVGMSLRDCWTARIQYSAIERSNVHCLHWENATAGEITGCRMDSLREPQVSGRGRDCVYVTFGQRPPFHETLALSVSNNSFQSSERAGFRGVGLGNVTFTNNFFENDNRSGESAALMLENPPTEPPDGASAEWRRPMLRVVNITGGFITPGEHGKGPAVCIGDYALVNITGLDIRGSALRRGLHLFGRESRVNITGVHSTLDNYVRSPHLDVRGSVLPLVGRRSRPAPRSPAPRSPAPRR
jgi:hypothetical protein